MLVSIIIPYFKKKEYINDAINSVLNQTYKNFEVILINDEPGNDSQKILIGIKKKDKRIRIIQNKRNIGAGLSRNKGIKNSRGSYIAFIDSDDVWNKNKLKNQINFMKKYNYDISHTAYFIDNNKSKKNFLRESKTLDYSGLKYSCDIGLSTVVINKKILKKNRSFFSNFKTKEDYFFWLRLSKEGRVFHYLNKPLTSWKKTENSLSSSTIQKLIDSYNVYFYYEKSFFISVFRTLILSLNFLKKRINDFRIF